MSMRSRRPAVEGLESRRLMAVSITAYPIPSGSTPTGIANGTGGLVYFDEEVSPGVGAIGTIDPTTRQVFEYAIPHAGSDPAGMVEGTDGAFWFADYGANAIGRYDPTTHAVTEYAVPTSGAGPLAVAVADGLVWFTEYWAGTGVGPGQLGSIDPKTHAIVEYSLTSATSNPSSLAHGPDGNLWFTEPDIHSVGEFSPTDHTTKDFAVAGTITSGIAVGPDEQLWFGVALKPLRTGQDQKPVIEEIDPTSHAITSTPLYSGPQDIVAGGAIGGVIAGPDGKVYYESGHDFGLLRGGVDQRIESIGDLDPSTKAYELSATFPGEISLLPSMIVGPGGHLWFTGGAGIGEATIIPADQSAVAGTVTITNLGNASGAALPDRGAIVFADMKGLGYYVDGEPYTVAASVGSFDLGGLTVGSNTIRVVAYPGDATTSQSITTTGGGLTKGVSLGVHQTSLIQSVTYGPTPFGSKNPDVTTAEVTGLYNLLLGRAPDPAGLAAWVGAVEGGTSFAAVVDGFLRSTEYYDREVATYYSAILGRAATPSEVGVWANRLAKGYTESQVVSLILESSEFDDLHRNDASFIQGLYNILLERQASTSELFSWETYLAGTSRSQVVSAILNGIEADRRVAQGLISTFWGYPPDPTAIGNASGALQSGWTTSELATFLLEHDPYRQYANASVG